MNDPTVFIDANVLLEPVLKNRLYAETAAAYIISHPTVISPLSAHLLVHLGKKDGLKLDFLLALLTRQKFTDLGTSEIMWAIENCQAGDFEDALQVACAIRYDCQIFVTFDKNIAKRYRKFIDIKVLGTRAVVAERKPER